MAVGDHPRMWSFHVLLLFGVLFSFSDGQQTALIRGQKYSEACEPRPGTETVNTHGWELISPGPRRTVTEVDNVNIYQTIIGQQATLHIKVYDGATYVFKCLQNDRIILLAAQPTNTVVIPAPRAVFNETRFNDTHFMTSKLICTWNVRFTTPVPSGTWLISLLNTTNYNASGIAYNVPLHRNYTGNYACMTENVAGRDTSQHTTVVIQHPPEVTVKSPSITSNAQIGVGKTLLFKCVFEAIPNVTSIRMFFTNRSSGVTSFLTSFSFNMNSMQTSKNSSIGLNITHVQFGQHSGEYICKASNQLGSTNHSLSVDVVTTPSSPVNLTFSQSEKTTVLLKWSVPSDDGNSTITSYYSNCTSLTGVAHVSIEKQFIKDMLNSTYCNASGYCMQCNTIGYCTFCNSTGHCANVTDLPKAPSLFSLNASGLHAGETYECRVFAENLAGKGSSSNPVTVQLLADVPCEPVLSVSNQTSNSSLRICLSWRVGCSGGRNISNCSLTRSDGHLFFWPASNDFCKVDGQAKVFCDDTEKNPRELYTYSFFIMNSLGTTTDSVQIQAGQAANPPTQEPTEAPTSGLSADVLGAIIGAGCGALILMILVVVVLAKSASKPNPIYDVTRTSSDPAMTGFSPKSDKDDVKYASVAFRPHKVGTPSPVKVATPTAEYASINTEKTRFASNSSANNEVDGTVV